MMSESHIKLNPGTIQEVRKEIGLDKPGMMDQAIDILEDWIQKQDHFVVKNFRRDYLERIIISTKGSVEKAKRRIDRLCTMRTMLPSLFEKCHAKNDFPNISDWYTNVSMPQITNDNHRIYIVKINSNKLSASKLREGYQFSILLSEYVFRHDYARGYQVICDLRDVNIMDMVTSIDLIDLRNMMTLYTDGYGFRIKSINVLSNSSMVGAFVDVLKQIVSAKIGQRIAVCKTMDTLHERVAKQFLPEDYGGEQKSITALYDEWTEELSSDNHLAYINEMKRCCTDEKLRRADKYNEECLGMPGSFKRLCVD